MKKIAKSLESSFYWVILKTCSLIFQHCPKKGMYTFARLLGMTLYVFAYKHRRVAYEGLSQAMELTNGRRHKVVVKCFMSIAKSCAEMAFFLKKPNELRRHIRVRNAGILDAALKRGKGVVLVSAHFGNFPLMLGRLSLEGYPVGVIMRPMKDKRIEEMFLPECRRIGLKPIFSIPRRECVQQSLRWLRDNRILFVPIDQNFGTNGVYVDFFGRKAATATGPVVLAERTDASVIPVFIIREKDNTHTIIFEPELELVDWKSKPDHIQENIQRITVIMERYIRKYPHEWSWIHRRWKSRPKN